MLELILVIKRIAYNFLVNISFDDKIDKNKAVTKSWYEIVAAINHV